MRIMLAPGERLVVGFYVPADPTKTGGWTPPEDHDCDGQFVIVFGQEAIHISSDMPDDQGREGLIYEASHTGDSDDEEAKDGS